MRALFLPLLLVAAAPSPQARVEAEITAAINASAAGWNAGDLERFMAVYTADAIYAAKDEVLRGRAAIAARYQPGFTGRGNLRGRLNFTPLAFRPAGAGYQLLVARWRLTGGARLEQGVTTLLFQRQRAGWRIVSDHSS